MALKKKAGWITVRQRQATAIMLMSVSVMVQAIDFQTENKGRKLTLHQESRIPFRFASMGFPIHQPSREYYNSACQQRISTKNNSKVLRV